MKPRPLSPTVHTALDAYTSGGAVTLAYLAHSDASDRRSRAEDRYEDARRSHETPILAAVRRRLGLDAVGVPIVEVRALIDHRDRSARALITVRVPLRGNDSVTAAWLSGGSETMEAWLARVGEACRVLCPGRGAP